MLHRERQGSGGGAGRHGQEGEAGFLGDALEGRRLLVLLGGLDEAAHHPLGGKGEVKQLLDDVAAVAARCHVQEGELCAKDAGCEGDLFVHWTVLQRHLHHVARGAVRREHLDVFQELLVDLRAQFVGAVLQDVMDDEDATQLRRARREGLRQSKTNIGRPLGLIVLQEMLDDEVAVLVPAQLIHGGHVALHQCFQGALCAMLDEPLEDTASVLVPGHGDGPLRFLRGPLLRKNLLDEQRQNLGVRARRDLDHLLQHMVAVPRLVQLHPVLHERPSQTVAAGGAQHREQLLNEPAAALRQSQARGAREDPLQDLLVEASVLRIQQCNHLEAQLAVLSELPRRALRVPGQGAEADVVPAALLRLRLRLRLRLAAAVGLLGHLRRPLAPRAGPRPPQPAVPRRGSGGGGGDAQRREGVLVRGVGQLCGLSLGGSGARPRDVAAAPALAAVAARGLR
mmetsp:Transcript_176790/g.567033  ORF Transcript_176790/g.567033 Transcript_176790/m.567033 type:complete len:454 (-) Transcript_176790:399-1760(-)